MPSALTLLVMGKLEEIDSVLLTFCRSTCMFISLYCFSGRAKVRFCMEIMVEKLKIYVL